MVSPAEIPVMDIPIMEDMDACFAFILRHFDFKKLKEDADQNEGSFHLMLKSLGTEACMVAQSLLVQLIVRMINRVAPDNSTPLKPFKHRLLSAAVITAYTTRVVWGL
jgi:hypothetical protein